MVKIEASRMDEEPLDPALAICDAHHHLWDFLDNRYLVEDFLRDIGGDHRIIATVFLECLTMYYPNGPVAMQPVGETDFVQRITSRWIGEKGATTVAAGIVGYADLTLGSKVAPVLEAHLAAGGGRFRGIRHGTTWDASAEVPQPKSSSKGLLLDPRFREGFACLRKYGLSFDSWLYHPQLMELADLARVFPDTTIVVDHIGGPLGIGPYLNRRSEVFRDWKRDIAALALYPNVVVKLGGMGMPRFGFGWQGRHVAPGSAEVAEALAPYYLWCIERFGVERCMFESNFPVDKVSYSYTILWNAFKRIAKGFSREERAALFYETARKVYRLVRQC